jgi:hypothetical protein
MSFAQEREAESLLVDEELVAEEERLRHERETKTKKILQVLRAYKCHRVLGVCQPPAWLSFTLWFELVF